MQEYIENVDAIWQWLAVILASAIPYVESYFGATFGVLAGMPPVVAILAASIGNIASMLGFVFFGNFINRKRKPKDGPVSKRKQKSRDMFDKYGVAGVSLLGQTLLPSQITSMTMVAFGANRKSVIFWQVISIILWGAVFGTFTALGVSLID